MDSGYFEYPQTTSQKKRLTDTPGASSSESWQLAGWASSKAAAGTTKRKDSSCGQSFLGYSGGWGNASTKRFIRCREIPVHPPILDG